MLNRRSYPVREGALSHSGRHEPKGLFAQVDALAEAATIHGDEHLNPTFMVTDAQQLDC